MPDGIEPSDTAFELASALREHLARGESVHEFLKRRPGLTKDALTSKLASAAREHADADLVRRIELEAQLLNDRTNTMLVINGLAAVAVGTQGVPRIAIAGVALAINLAWIAPAAKSDRYQRVLQESAVQAGAGSIGLDLMASHYWHQRERQRNDAALRQIPSLAPFAGLGRSSMDLSPK